MSRLSPLAGLFLLLVLMSCAASHQLPPDRTLDSRDQCIADIWTTEGAHHSITNYHISGDTLAFLPPRGMFHQPDSTRIPMENIRMLKCRQKSATALLGWTAILISIFAAGLFYALSQWSGGVGN